MWFHSDRKLMEMTGSTNTKTKKISVLANWGRPEQYKRRGGLRLATSSDLHLRFGPEGMRSAERPNQVQPERLELMISAQLIVALHSRSRGISVIALDQINATTPGRFRLVADTTRALQASRCGSVQTGAHYGLRCCLSPEAAWTVSYAALGSTSRSIVVFNSPSAARRSKTSAALSSIWSLRSATVRIERRRAGLRPANGFPVSRSRND